MVSKLQEIISLMLNLLSFICECLLYCINNNSHIKLLCLYDLVHHLVKVIRIIIFGYELVGSPLWFCLSFSFINHFTHNGSLIMSCMYISILYICIYYSNNKHNKKN